MHFEHQYFELLKEILKDGETRHDRTQVGTKAIFGYEMEIDISSSFPAMTTKKLAFNAMKAELLWFIEGSGDERRLCELTHGSRGAHLRTIWSGNAEAPYWKEKAKFNGDLGRVYGVNWRRWERVHKVMPESTNSIKPPEYNLPPEFFLQNSMTASSELNDPMLVNNLYSQWNMMMRSCYATHSIGFTDGRNFEVCEKWRQFNGFLDDFRKIPGWELKTEYPFDYCLSILHSGKRTYNRVNAKWVRKDEYAVNLEVHSGSAPFFYTAQTDQLQKLLATLKHDPAARRHIISAWNVGELDEMALPPCHMMAQFYLDGQKRLSCKMTQRSVDVFLGLPFNIASYALLTAMVARDIGATPHKLLMSLGDCHIYVNQIDAVNEQLKRKPSNLPRLVLASNRNTFNYRMEDINLEGYFPAEQIKAPMAV